MLRDEIKLNVGGDTGTSGNSVDSGIVEVEKKNKVGDSRRNGDISRCSIDVVAVVVVVVRWW